MWLRIFFGVVGVLEERWEQQAGGGGHTGGARGVESAVPARPSSATVLAWVV